MVAIEECFFGGLLAAAREKPLGVTRAISCWQGGDVVVQGEAGHVLTQKGFEEIRARISLSEDLDPALRVDTSIHCLHVRFIGQPKDRCNPCPLATAWLGRDLAERARQSA